MPSETCRNGGANYKNNAYCEVRAKSPALPDLALGPCLTPAPAC